MLENNRLTGDFDLLTGASNSLKRAFLPLAQRIAARLDGPPDADYLSSCREYEPGLRHRIQVFYAPGRATLLGFDFDGFFAPQPEAIANPAYRPFYRQSLRAAPDYQSSVGVGFDRYASYLEERVLATQSLDPEAWQDALPGGADTEELRVLSRLLHELEAARQGIETR